MFFFLVVWDLLRNKNIWNCVDREMEIYMVVWDVNVLLVGVRFWWNVYIV